MWLFMSFLSDENIKAREIGLNCVTAYFCLMKIFIGTP